MKFSPDIFDLMQTQVDMPLVIGPHAISANLGPIVNSLGAWLVLHRAQEIISWALIVIIELITILFEGITSHLHLKMIFQQLPVNMQINRTHPLKDDKV